MCIHDVHHIISPPLRHVARNARVRRPDRAGRNLRVKRCRVALPANVVIVLSHRFPTRHAMRIMARQARQRSSSVRGVALPKSIAIDEADKRSCPQSRTCLHVPYSAHDDRKPAKVPSGSPGAKRKSTGGPGVKLGSALFVSSRWHCMQTSICRLGLSQHRIHDARRDMSRLRARRPHCPDMIAAGAMAWQSMPSGRSPVNRGSAPGAWFAAGIFGIALWQNTHSYETKRRVCGCRESNPGLMPQSPPFSAYHRAEA